MLEYLYDTNVLNNLLSIDTNLFASLIFFSLVLYLFCTCLLGITLIETYRLLKKKEIESKKRITIKYEELNKIKKEFSLLSQLITEKHEILNLDTKDNILEGELDDILNVIRNNERFTTDKNKE